MKKAVRKRKSKNKDISHIREFGRSQAQNKSQYNIQKINNNKGRGITP